MKTRFAPSPTGLLHLGHAYAAWIAYQRAKKAGGTFLLRFEDIDYHRVRKEYYEATEEDLRWLGLRWEEEPWRQLDRLPHYENALSRLKEMGLLYPCFCSRKEIQHELTQLSDAPHGPEGPLYPATCRNLSGKNRKKLLENSEPAWRLDSLKAANLVGKLTFEDTLHGKIKVDPLLLGDLILSRRDIGTSYHLAVVIDDAAQEIDLVTRGEDLLGATHLHRVLQALLNLPQPHYEHHRLIVDDRGRRLAKRDKSTSLRHLRDTGWTPEEVMASFGC